MKNPLNVVIMMGVLVIISTSIGYFLGNRNGFLASNYSSPENILIDYIPKTSEIALSGIQKEDKDHLHEFLITLSNLIINKKVKTISDLESFLLNTYGPCWGIPEGQCEE